ncbi:winged helix-turn-helix transcriptional regulator [Halovenus salina]|uniref:winged helix-turn-helix transcriptional regulator n=1 Tax=Halovenus salina TaxID=1510225 RepID=UPI002260BB91|nr:winged helix-turn-helix transcriptional regulator [Halovenus salina]
MSTDEESKYPRSVRHKQILDKAEANPDASMDDLASMVPSATTELVERTLDEYGDPATAEESDSPDGEDEQDVASEEATNTEPTEGNTTTEMTDANTTSTDQSTESASAVSGESGDDEVGSEMEATVDTTPEDDDTHDESGAREQPTPTPADLTAKQREVLECIAAKPTATQREIGEELGVSSATINNRVNSIDGFEWNDRAAFVDEVLGLDGDTETETVEGRESTVPAELESTLANIDHQLTVLDERIDDLEDSIEGETARDCTASGFDDPELVHKVVHACLESERVTEDEELQLLQQLLS